MPSFRKLCARLCCLRQRKLKIQDYFQDFQDQEQVYDEEQDQDYYTPQGLVTTDKIANSVSDLDS